MARRPGDTPATDDAPPIDTRPTHNACPRTTRAHADIPRRANAISTLRVGKGARRRGVVDDDGRRVGRVPRTDRVGPGRRSPRPGPGLLRVPGRDPAALGWRRRRPPGPRGRGNPRGVLVGVWAGWVPGPAHWPTAGPHHSPGLRGGGLRAVQLDSVVPRCPIAGCVLTSREDPEGRKGRAPVVHAGALPQPVGVTGSPPG
jgi:hypothetical protein